MVKLICIVLFPFITFAGLHWKSFDFSENIVTSGTSSCFASDGIGLSVLCFRNYAKSERILSDSHILNYA